MIEGIGEAIIRRPQRAIIDFVTDLESYKKADWKIGRVLEMRREDDDEHGNKRIFMRHDGKLRGIPGPPVSLEMVVTEGEKESSVRYHSISSFPSSIVLTFDGGFELTETGDGIRVVHTERFRFFLPFRWVAEPFLRHWIANDVREEMDRLKTLLEAES